MYAFYFVAKHPFLVIFTQRLIYFAPIPLYHQSKKYFSIIKSHKIMSKVSIYLNFQGKTEEAFNFYKSVFHTEFAAPIMYNKDIPAHPGMPPLSENELGMVMHVALPILGGVQIMGTDMLESMGHKVQIGNNITINLEPDTREETERLFNALSEGGSDIAPLEDQFWGALWGACLDKYGIRWMFNHTPQQ
jgi:PhnB protein